MNTKVLFLLAITLLMSFSSFAQRSVRIGYIDTEYILQNVPEYQQASAQLETKIQKWKSEIEERLSEIDQKKNQLSNESVLLTPELIEERQEEIDIEESEILDYQQKRFGPNGDLMIQKKQLMQPIQDQIFIAVQEIAANRKYDFVFDKSADVVMLYSADRFDISEQVLRSITRSSKRKQAQSRNERKAAEEEELIPEINKEQEARDQAIADKKAARQKLIEDRRAKQLEAREAERKELEDKKKKILEDRAKAREEKLKARNNTSEEKISPPSVDEATGEETSDLPEVAEESANGVSHQSGAKSSGTAEDETPALSPREARKKALEEKKKKILEDRARARREKAGLPDPSDGLGEAGNRVSDSTNADSTEKKAEPKLSDRELRQKALEEKKKKILAERKANMEARKREKDSIAAAKKGNNNN